MAGIGHCSICGHKLSHGWRIDDIFCPNEDKHEPVPRGQDLCKHPAVHTVINYNTRTVKSTCTYCGHVDVLPMDPLRQVSQRVSKARGCQHKNTIGWHNLIDGKTYKRCIDCNKILP